MTFILCRSNLRQSSDKICMNIFDAAQEYGRILKREGPEAYCLLQTPQGALLDREQTHTILGAVLDAYDFLLTDNRYDFITNIPVE